MSNNSDWLPGSRAGQLAMAKNWLTHETKLNEWGITKLTFQELEGSASRAETAMHKAASSEGNKALTKQCDEAFGEMIAIMRDWKKRYFLKPPLIDSDFVALGLPIPGKKPSPIPAPSGFPEADVGLPGVGVLELYCRPVKGQPPLDSRSDYGYRIHWGIMPPGGATAEQAPRPQGAC